RTARNLPFAKLGYGAVPVPSCRASRTIGLRHRGHRPSRRMGARRLHPRSDTGVFKPPPGYRAGTATARANRRRCRAERRPQHRLAKDHRGEAELKLEWRERAAAIRLDFGKLGAAQGPEPNVAERPIQARAAVTYSAAHNTEREAVMDRRALETIALHPGMCSVANS